MTHFRNPFLSGATLLAALLLPCAANATNGY